MNWAGIENGELLALAASAEFDALVTKDTKLQYEHNLGELPISIVVLHAPSNDLDDIRPRLPSLLRALAQLNPRQVTHVS
jgi:hypothetical protein